MKLANLVKTALVWLAFAGFMTVQLAPAAPANLQGPAPAARDVALRPDGSLEGQLLSVQGAPLADVQVMLVRQGKVAATAKTDARGWFSVKGLKAGVYQLQAGQAGALVRVWTPDAAPPSAAQGALIVADENVVRAQNRVVGFLTNPIVLGGIIATAIVLPLALDNDDAS